MATVAPNSIPTPSNFPVTWKHPEDERQFWTQDRMHFPDPLTPLDHEFTQVVYRGFDKAAQRYEMPIHAQVRHINTYHYSATAPLMLPPDEMEAMEKRAEANIGAAMAQLDHLWNDEWLPEIQGYIDSWASFDLPGTPMPHLISHLDESWARLHRLWEIHFLAIFPMMLAISVFDDFYQDLFDDADTFDAYKLLQGFENKTVETGRALWQLSRKAIEAALVLETLRESPVSEVIPALQRSEEGRLFLAELNAYLDVYGRRGDDLGLSYPDWIEDPTSVITRLKEYAGQTERDLDHDLDALAAERERLVAEARERLSNYPGPVKEQFESLLKAAQIGTVLSEDHAFYIDFSCNFWFRQVILEFGRRFLEEGVIEHRDDVFYLTFEELRETAENPGQLDRRALIAERRAEVEHFRTIQPPPALGTMPSGPPPDNAMTRQAAKFWGVPPTPSDDPDVLFGASGSSGVVQGPAKVVLSISEAHKLQPGDVLIAPTTVPSWTPLFATAAAVVTDTGGILSHCAVVAREYGIPAVVGTGRATSMFSDGQIIEVDGNQGIVRIIHPD